MINEEIGKIKYLFGYKSGVVISEQTTPTTGDTTTKIKQNDLDKLRDCSSYNSTGTKSTNKLTKGEETNEFIIFNGSDGKPACKKPKEKK